MKANTLLTAAAAVTLFSAVSLAQAQQYPSKPIRIVNPYSAGGGLDTVFRPLAK